MSETKTLKQRVFQTCEMLAQANKTINLSAVKEKTGGKARDVDKCISEWRKEKEKSALAVLTKSEISQAPQESTIISDESVPIQPVISSADVAQIQLNAAERVKMLRLAEIEVARAMQENPELLPEEIRREIEEAEMAAVSTPLFHRAYYDANLLAQAVIATL